MLSRPQTLHKYPSGLLYSSIICIACIVLIILNQWTHPLSTKDNDSSNASLGNIRNRSVTTIQSGGTGQNISTGVEKIAQDISAQSEQQRHTMQVENTNPDFHPEQLIPKYFKVFNGDASSMQK